MSKLVFMTYLNNLTLKNGYTNGGCQNLARYKVLNQVIELIVFNLFKFYLNDDAYS